MTDEIMFEIRDMTGQEYKNSYATKKSQTIQAAEVKVVSAEPERQFATAS
jgi:hypothetical protein